MKAIVMGATSGIGLEVTRELTRRGWEVGIAGRRQERLQAIQSKNLNIVATQCVDITSANAADALQTLIGKMGDIDLYVHSSGIGYQNVALGADLELDTVNTNALGFTRMLTTVYHYFAEKGGGHIAVISSIAGTKGLGAAPSYSATKRYQSHYIESLQQLSRMQRHNISFTDIRPGFVATDMIKGSNFPLQLAPDSVARKIVKAIEKHKTVATIDWRYRILVTLWRMVPRWIWVRMKVKTT